MNIPLEVAQAQGRHGAKGAAHGIKGGRPRLDLTNGERAERRRKQQEAYRRKKGILPRVFRPTRWVASYIAIWGKPPDVPLTPEEYALREPLWNAWIAGR
jgi:hypothetical protein